MRPGYGRVCLYSDRLLTFFFSTLDEWSQLVLDDSFDPSSEAAQVRAMRYYECMALYYILVVN